MKPIHKKDDVDLTSRVFLYRVEVGQSHKVGLCSIEDIRPAEDVMMRRSRPFSEVEK